MKHITTLTDWTTDDLTRVEFEIAIAGHSRSPMNTRISHISAQSHPLHLSYLLAQLARTIERSGIPQEHLLYLDLRSASTTDLVIARLYSGLTICSSRIEGIHTDVRHEIERTFLYSTEVVSSLTSIPRDHHAVTCAYIGDYLHDELDLEEMHTPLISSDSPEYRIGHIDDREGIYTTLKVSDVTRDYTAGSSIQLRVSDEVIDLVYESHLRQSSECVLVPGSHGDLVDPYLQICHLPDDLCDRLTVAAPITILR